MADLTPASSAIAPTRRPYRSAASGETLVGLQFGEYVVLRLEDPPHFCNDRYIRRYICRCSCGKERAIPAQQIKQRPPFACRSCTSRRSANGIKTPDKFVTARRTQRNDNYTKTAKIHLVTGFRFGAFTVVSDVPRITVHGTTLWDCRCDCGKIVGKNTTEIKKTLTLRCHDCEGNRRRKLVEESGLQHILNGYVQAARQRKLVFNLDKETVSSLIRKPCFYCGLAHSNTYKKPKPDELFVYNGIDRLDPTIGYTNSNVVPCCGERNTAKWDRTKDEFVALVSRIMNHLNLNAVKA